MLRELVGMEPSTRCLCLRKLRVADLSLHWSALVRTSALLFSAIGLLIEPLNTRQGSFHQGVKDSNVHNDNITQAVRSHGFYQALAWMLRVAVRLRHMADRGGRRTT